MRAGLTGYEGQVVLNYRLTTKLGSGGFGVVYLAEQLELGRRVACKILHPHFAREPAVVDRFFREARAVCEIGHRAIVAIENFGRLPAGEPFYLMELAPGRSLTRIVEEHWLTSEQLIAIFDPIADALGAAHAKQIVHRDLKPDNIMVQLANDRVDDVRLLDFGIAKLLDGDGAGSITGTGLGTPAYMAPEQAIDAKHVDARADVYAFGATLYMAISRRPPFTDNAIAAILHKARTQNAPALTALRPGVSEALDAAVARCLAKSREHRPPTIAEAWSPIRAVLAQHALPVLGAPAAAATWFPPPGPIAVTLPPDIPTPADAPIGAALIVAEPHRDHEDVAPKRRAKRKRDKRRAKRTKPIHHAGAAKRIRAVSAAKRDARAMKRTAKRAHAVKRARAPKRDAAAQKQPHHAAVTKIKLRWIVLVIAAVVAIGLLVNAR